MKAGGGFVVAWHGFGGVIQGASYGPDDQLKAGPFPLVPSGNPEFSISADASSQVVIVYEGASSIMFARFDLDGKPLAAPNKASRAPFTNASQAGPVVSMLPDGRFVVAWDNRIDYQGTLFMQRFSRTGEAIGLGVW
jgi:hypothetical protein